MFFLFCFFFKDESEYLKSVCSAAGDGTDRNPDKYVLRLHCSLSRVCVKSCVCVCICARLVRAARPV